MLLLNKNVYLDQNLALLLAIRHAPRFLTAQLQYRLGLECTSYVMVFAAGV